jgi:hypothetical protein
VVKNKVIPHYNYWTKYETKEFGGISPLERKETTLSNLYFDNQFYEQSNRKPLDDKMVEDNPASTSFYVEPDSLEQKKLEQDSLNVKYASYLKYELYKPDNTKSYILSNKDKANVVFLYNSKRQNLSEFELYNENLRTNKKIQYYDFSIDSAEAE